MVISTRLLPAVYNPRTLLVCWNWNWNHLRSGSNRFKFPWRRWWRCGCPWKWREHNLDLNFRSRWSFLPSSATYTPLRFLRSTVVVSSDSISLPKPQHEGFRSGDEKPQPRSHRLWMDSEKAFDFEDVEPPDDNSPLLITDGSESDRGFVSTCWGMGLSLLGVGWRVGKKVALASAVVTSAPVVLPPLVIMSTVGFFFAVPFGVLFAGYAAADKIVRALLPVLLLENGMEESGRSEFVEGGGEGWVEEEGEDALAEEREEVPEKSLEKERYDTAQVGEEEDKGVVGEREKIEVEEKGVDTEELDEERAAEGKRKHSMGEEELPEKKRLEVLMKTGADGNQFFDVTGGDIVVYPVVIEETVDAVSLVEVPQGLVAVVRDVEVAEPRDDQEALSEEKIWEQIDAMRIIVGYKAVRNPSCVEELRALYLFTGVEPPFSSASPFDLSEVNDKLQFLKSVVGVK